MDEKDQKIAYLEKIIGLAPGNVYWKDKQGRYLGSNDNFAKIVKLPSREAIVGKTDYELMSKELADMVYKADQEIMAANKERALEELGYDINGEPAIYLSKKVPLHDDDGQVIGIFGTSIDITERKNYESSLKKAKEELEITDKNKTAIIKNNEFLTQVIDLLPCNIYWKNRQGVYLGCNQNVAKVMGWDSSNEIVGKTVFDFCQADLAIQIDANDENVMQNNQEINIEEQGSLADGKLASFITRKVPLYDDNGNVTGLLGVSFDITERKQMEQALVEAKKQIELSNKAKAEFIQNMTYLQNVIAVLPGNIYWKNRQGIYLGCNDNAAHLVGLASGKEVVGKRLHDFVDKKYADAIEENDEKIMSSNKEETLEENAFDTKGNPAVYLTRKTPLHNEKGEVIGLLGLSLDISERKEYEIVLKDAKDRAEAASRAKSDFLAVVSHELRIPLTGILGMAQLLEGANLYPEQRDQLADLIKSSEHLLTLINDLLDIAKLEAGKMDFHYEPADLRKILQEMTNIISQQARLKGLELLVDYPYEIPSLVISDARAIRQIILNLTGNAIKFTEQGYVIIKVSCIDINTTQATLAIKVEDTGIGIPTDKLSIIFDRFAQADNSRTRRYGGTGLGLAITKEYIEAMGGTLTVQSEIGKGTVFTCTIPFDLQTAFISADPWESYRAQVKILIVDDTLRGEVLRKHIGSSSSQVIDSKNALNVLRAAQQAKKPFDIVIIDQQLSSSEPLELSQLIKQQAKLQQPMLILLASKLSLPAQKKAKEVGYFDFLFKPIQPIEMLINLTAAWEKWQALSSLAARRIVPIAIKNTANLPQILLVEDEPIIQRVHKVMLEKMGCKVEVADTGERALAKFTDKYYEIVFLDIGLPDINGFDVAKEMRYREVERGYTPIIGITGYNSEEDKYRCLQAGMDEVVIKPAKPEELKAVVEKWLLARKRQ